MEKSKKYHVVSVTEILHRQIVVECDDDYENSDIEEIVDEMCGGGMINLDEKDFSGRQVSVLWEADHKDRAQLKVYRLEGEPA